MRAGLSKLGIVSRKGRDLFRRGQTRRLPLRRLVEVVLILLLLVQGGRLVWLWLAPEPKTESVRALDPVDTSILSRFDAFFRQGGQTIEAGSEGAGMTLFGVQADGAGGGSAIIGLSEGRQVSAVAGEEIEPGLSLKSVAADHVILSRGGASLRLDFPDMAGASGPLTPVATDETASQAATEQSEADRAVVIDAQRLVAQAGLRPRIQGLGIKGLTVSASGNGSELRQAGLQSGDIILSVNGVALDNPQSIAALRSQLAEAPSAQIQFERDGQVRSTTVRTRQ